MKYIFGPVPSRRLGSSLGIDVVPFKTCDLDCIYCEVGKTNHLTIKRDHYINIDHMLEELKRIYPAVKDHLDVVTVTGSGEPTLNIDIKIIATEIKKIISHPLVLLTNSTLVTNNEVKDAMMLFDVIVPSVDAVSNEVFRKINRPHSSLNLINILDQLREFSHTYNGKLFIEVLLVEGINDNFEEIGKIATYIKTLKYDKVQLNTVFRPPAYPDAKGINQENYLRLQCFKKRGLKWNLWVIL